MNRLASIAALGLALSITAASSVSADGVSVASVAPAAVTVLDKVDIPWGWRMSEMSGLAWDQDEQLLYAVSDLGHLVQFKVDLNGDKIASVDAVFYGPLSLTVGQEQFHDTEDLVAINSANGKKGDTELGVVFEDGPAAARFTGKGDLIAPIPLPPALIDRSAYRQPNQRLEAIALLSDGTFVLGPQTPLKSSKRSLHTLYDTDGRRWTYKADQKKGSSTKALQTLPDGSLLILEAENDQDIWGKIGLGGKEMHIRRLDLASCGGDKRCTPTDYPAFGEPIRGRFEGITNIKDDLFLMITDASFGAELILVRIPITAR